MVATYSEQLPSEGPPSFSGRLVKYSYKLAVGAQRLGCPAQITRVPFRVLVIPKDLYLPYVSSSPRDTNPFLVSEVKEDPTLELSLQALAAETSRRTSCKTITVFFLSPLFFLCVFVCVCMYMCIHVCVCAHAHVHIVMYTVNYTLKNQNGILGRISLYKSSYKLGEDITGTLDLNGATIACLQVRTRELSKFHHHSHLFCVLIGQSGPAVH